MKMKMRLSLEDYWTRWHLSGEITASKVTKCMELSAARRCLKSQFEEPVKLTVDADQ
jgi:hypothetical protein